MKPMSPTSKRFRVAFSFAGEKRGFVSKVATILAGRFGESSILYDKYHEAEFARRNLGFLLPNLYREESELIIAVICHEYQKEWCGLEWAAIYDLLKTGRDDQVMLCRFDRAQGAGLYSTAGYLDLDEVTPQYAAARILERLALNEKKPKEYYLASPKAGAGSRPNDRRLQSPRRPAPLKAAEDDRVATIPGFRWLHISDIHFKEDESWDRRATLRALITKVRELKDTGLAPDLVFVTGDIAYSGKAKEYEHAMRFFHELNQVLELDPKDRWFLVPGNHDVDRSRITRAHRAIQAGLTDEMIVEETLRDVDTIRLLSTRLEAYYAFASDFLGPARALQPDRPWRTDMRELAGVTVGILQLNSTWIAEGGDADKANLLIGEAQLREALDATPDAFMRIALMHHPLRNMREFDEHRIESLLTASGGATFLLRGHLHLNRMKLQSSPDGRLYELAAGALYTDEERRPRGFHLGEIDVTQGEARIHLFRFSDDSKGFFAPDNLTYENAPNGICKIRLPLRLENRKTKTTRAISEATRLSFVARYRQASAAYHGHARFIGFPNLATRPNARVSDLFVPLLMKSRIQRTAVGEVRTTQEIAQRLLGPPQSHAPRIVILGDPGSGKTTLSRFLVMLAAGVISMPGVKIEGEPLPLRVPIREFMEKRRDDASLSLVAYLEWQAKSELSLDVPKNFLRDAMAGGRAVLLLDGLDEVGAAEQRDAMRDLIGAFAANHGRLPILITTRIAGYDEAPMAGGANPAEAAGLEAGSSLSLVPVQEGHGLALFNEFVLEKFNDASLETFVTHWYSVQEPTDPVARDRGTADLLAALNADERVRELARTPILATLIAMIHRVEANLPGERAKLYELCVRMLLETWPAQAKRLFHEIDSGLQRAYLESLAFGLQKGRTALSREAVTVARGDLISRLLSIIRKRDRAEEPEESVVKVIERWVDHLERQSGILIEQTTGVYTFLHLSIMEYLAAQGMERELGRDDTVTTIAGDCREGAWREVCLLAVGSHAEDGDFLDAVYDRVVAVADFRRWDFLLRCLREEARFRPEQRESILAQYSASILPQGHWFTDSDLIDQIRRFSVRHGEAVQRWIEHHLDHASGRELAAIALVAMRPDALVVTRRLDLREDRSAAAGALLDFWPGSQLGEWAVGAADTASLLTWSHVASHDLRALRSLAALTQRAPTTAAAILALNARTLRACNEGATNVLRVSEVSRTGGKGLPAHVRVEPGQVTLVVAPRLPLHSRLTDASPRFARNSSRELARDFASDFVISAVLTGDFPASIVFEYVLAFANTFASDFTGTFGNLLVQHSARDFAGAFAPSLLRAFGKAFAKDLQHHFGGGFADAFAIAFAIDTGYGGRNSSTQLRLLRRAASQGEALQIVRALYATFGAEEFIALATMAGNNHFEECAGYFMSRLQNRWLFEVWDAIDARLPPEPTPAQLALYFALGWAQSTTTWAWPDSERWRALFDAGPGEHWLVRSQWHLCKLTEDSTSEEDQAALRAALRDGRRDEELPGYAERLGEILGVE